MKLEEVTWISENGEGISKDLVFSDFNGLLAVNKMVALPLRSVSSIYSDQSEIEVDDSDGVLLGFLCLCKGKNIDLSKMTEAQNVCYLSEIEKDNYGFPYQLQKDYFVLEIDRFDDYKQNYLETSLLWGGYVHEVHGTKQPYSQTASSIVAISNIHLPTSYHVEAGARGVLQPYAFERYLKFYHLLELLFDYDTVEEIKSLGDDLKGIGKILATYDRTEIERLKHVIENRCKNFDKIAQKLNFAFSSDEFIEKSKTIFFEYGKEGNPLRDEKEQRFDELVLRGGFTEENAKQVKLATDRKQYEKLILSTSVYWLYRIRCSIAHNRIGEYVMTIDDEIFVAEFAEPLLKEILLQAFAK